MTSTGSLNCNNCNYLLRIGKKYIWNLSYRNGKDRSSTVH